MIQTRHRLLAILAAVVALGAAGQAFATPLTQLDYNAAKVLGAVQIAGGAIDLTNGAMIVTTSSFGFVPEGAYPGEVGSVGVAEYGEPAIHDAILEGLNPGHGYWNGTNGIMSSTVAGYANTDQSIGWVDLGNGTTLDSNFIANGFRGVSVNSSQSIITATWLGDFDLNGLVNTQDFAAWASGFSNNFSNGTNPEWVDGDVDYNGLVNTQDFAGWATPGGFPYPDGQTPVWGLSPAPIVPNGTSSAVSAVPEPTSLALLFLSGIVAIAIRFAPRRLKSNAS